MNRSEMSATPSEYLERVGDLLSDIDEEDRVSLLAELADQLQELPQTKLTERLGTPEEFAHEYRLSAGLEASIPDVQRSRPNVATGASVSKAVTGAVLLGYGLALAVFVMALVGNELTFWRALVGGLIALTLFAVPPVLAMLALPRRPLMLLPAGIIGLLGAFGMGSIVGLPLVILGLIWLWAYLRIAPPDTWVRKASMILVPLLWLGATAALWVHLDAACEQRLRDGTVIEVDPATRGFESGWTWEVGSTFSGSSGPISEDVVFEACTSNTLVAWEALSAVALAAFAVGVGFRLARPSDKETERVSRDHEQ